MEACSGILCNDCLLRCQLLALGLQPAPEFFVAYHADCSPHAVMPQTAELRADKLVSSNLRCLQVSADLHSRHRVLLEAHRRNKDTVNHVLGTQDQLDVTPHRQHERRSNNIVFPRWILRIKTEWLTFVGASELLNFHAPNLAVRARIPKIPLELNTCNFDGYRIALGRRTKHFRP